jgi:hypothetical protein
MFSGGYFEQSARSMFWGNCFLWPVYAGITNDNEWAHKFGSKFPGHAETKRAYFQDIAIGGAGNEWIPAHPE